jgi:hypothetical protein
MPIDSIALAEELNQTCHCIALDQLALEKNLKKASSSDLSYARLLKDQSSLFSSSPVFLARQQLLAMQEAVTAIEQVCASEGFLQWARSSTPSIAATDHGPSGAFQGYDFHLGKCGPQLIEINTNAGGALLNAMLARAQVACCREVDTVLGACVNAANLPDIFLAMFREEWRSQRPDRPLKSIAIVDEDPTNQFLYPEFELFQKLFREAGFDARIVDVADLEYREGTLIHDNWPIDLVYNRTTDFYFETPVSSALRGAYEAGDVVVTPNPSVYGRSADKRHLVKLSDTETLREWGIPNEVITTLARAVPRTLDVQSCDPSQLWKDRKQYFFKPMSGFAGKAAYRGDKITKKVWASILERPYVAQEIVAPSRRTLRIGEREVPLKLDVRNYTYRGKIQLTAARLYEGQTTNFRTLGGGFAPVFSEVEGWLSRDPASHPTS